MAPGQAEMFDGIGPGTRVERVGIGQKRPGCFPGDLRGQVGDPGRLDVAGVSFLSEMDFQGDKIFGRQALEESGWGKNGPGLLTERVRCFGPLGPDKINPALLA